ncbi:MAG: hypothetical protein IPI49_03590 [Myxococcales bacterium]|nr:hypothetical protein [Myxococcales bacterium]
MSDIRAEQSRVADPRRHGASLLRHRFGSEVDLHIEQKVAAASREQLEVWVMRVRPASALADVFA